MNMVQGFTSSAYYAAALRQELCHRNAAYARRLNLAHVLSFGEIPVIVYERFPEHHQHGNFLSSSYDQILARDSWRRRLDKVHSQAARSLPRTDKGWRELDSCTSSDALLMNVFCHPSAMAQAQLRTVLAQTSDDVPEFGIKPRVPLKRGRTDTTEIDMQLGGVFFESKLTEVDFQVAEAETVERYRDLELVFDVATLPRCDSKYLSYQLIRNVLAAHALRRDFCVLLDARRPDLREACYTVFRSIHEAELRTKCKVFTWQELVPFLATELKHFLDVKYGIVSPGETASTFADRALS